MATPTSLEDLRTVPTAEEVLASRLRDLEGAGFPALSWAPGDVPLGLAESEAEAEVEYRQAQKYVAEGALNSLAVDESLDRVSHEVYDDDRQEGRTTIGYETLTDTAGNGPFTFSATAVSFSVGVGGRAFDGVTDALTGDPTVTVPRNGSRDVLVAARGVGVEWNAASGTVDTFSRGGLPGVVVTNPPDWLTKYPACRVGLDAESDERLRRRNVARWKTPGAGSPADAFVYWAETASPDVTRVEVFTNLDMLDPGTVDVILAGPAGPVSISVVELVQDYIAPLQVGGSLIPATARCRVSSALARSLAVTAAIFLLSPYDTAAFRTKILDGLAVFFAALPIGALVSRERIIQVLLNPAGTSPGVIADADVPSPPADVQLRFDEVAVPVVAVTFVRA